MNLKQHRDNKFKGKRTLGPNIFAIESLEYIKKNKLKRKILDLGCGSGRDSIYFAEKGLDVTSMDISQSGIDILKSKSDIKNLNINIICDNILNLNFEENTFDIIYANLSLHYFNDIDTSNIFEEILKILKLGGILFIRCKSTSDILFGKGIEIEKNMFNNKGHIRHFFDKEYTKDKLNKFKKISKIKEINEKHITIEYGDYTASFIEAIAQK